MTKEEIARHQRASTSRAYHFGEMMRDTILLADAVPAYIAEAERLESELTAAEKAADGMGERARDAEAKLAASNDENRRLVDSVLALEKRVAELTEKDKGVANPEFPVGSRWTGNHIGCGVWEVTPTGTIYYADPNNLVVGPDTSVASDMSRERIVEFLLDGRFHRVDVPATAAEVEKLPVGSCWDCRCQVGAHAGYWEVVSQDRVRFHCDDGIAVGDSTMDVGVIAKNAANGSMVLIDPSTYHNKAKS